MISLSTWWAKKNKHYFYLAFIFTSFLVLFALLLYFNERRLGSDDFAFQKEILPFHTVFDWVVHRYHTWSGRIFAESFVYMYSPLPLIFWKITSLILYALFSGYIFLYYTLFTKSRSNTKDYIMMILSFTLPFLMDKVTFTDATLWVTGSMNYFWIIAFGLAAFYPVMHIIIKSSTPHWLIAILSLPCAIIAASSNEQAGAVMAVLSIIFTIYILFKRKVSLYLIGLTALIVGAFLVGILAPGNHSRIEIERYYRLPDFYVIPLFEHLKYSYRWFIDAIVNHLGALLIIYWALLLGLFSIKKKHKNLDKTDYLVISILFVSCLFLVLKGQNFLSYWFEFYPVWKVHAPKLSYIVLAPWTIALIATLVAPTILYRRKIKGLVLSILFGAVIATTLLITLSPSMYVSGMRVLYVPSIILLLISYFLFDRIYDHYKSIGNAFVISTLLLAGSQYLLLLKNVLDH